MLKYFICLIIIMNMSCSTNQSENILNEIIDSMGAEFPNVVRSPEKHRLQILYTQINRNQKKGLTTFIVHPFTFLRNILGRLGKITCPFFNENPILSLKKE